MNNVLGRIAELQARFEPLTRPAAATPTAAQSTDFSKALTSAQRASALGTASGGSSAAGLTSGLEALAASSGVDTTALSALSRLLQTATTATATTATAATGAAATGATGALPAAYSQYAETINQIATDEGVPASLLAALVWSESSFNPEAESSAGARGLAQLMPATAAGLGVDIDNPVDNLRGGARYLRQMLDRFGSPELALAAYNAGPGAVTKAGGIPDYPETQNYVTKVMARAATLAGAIA